jgi:hypothetical protein
MLLLVSCFEQQEKPTEDMLYMKTELGGCNISSAFRSDDSEKRNDTVNITVSKDLVNVFVGLNYTCKADPFESKVEITDEVICMYIIDTGGDYQRCMCYYTFDFVFKYKEEVNQKYKIVLLDPRNENQVVISEGVINNKKNNADVFKIKEKAVETLIIGSNTFVLDAYLWRDFMPVSPPDGKPMISINWLISTNLVKIPDNIDMVKQYVFYNDSVWVSTYENETRPDQPAHKIEKVSRNGPKWGPKINVDVVSQIHDSKTNKHYYIQRKKVFVERTD